MRRVSASAGIRWTRRSCHLSTRAGAACDPYRQWRASSCPTCFRQIWAGTSIRYCMRNSGCSCIDHCPFQANLLVNKRVVEAFDRGPRRGAMIPVRGRGSVRSRRYRGIYDRYDRGGTGRRRFWRQIRQRSCTASRAASRPGPFLRQPDAHRPGAAIPIEWRSQSLACRPRRSNARGIRCANTAWSVHVWHRLPRHHGDDL